MPQPKLPPLLAKTPAVAVADDEDEDEEEDEEFDEEAIRGWLAPDGATCVAIGGSVTAGVNGDMRAAPRGRVGSLRSLDVTTFPVTGIVKLDAMTSAGGWQYGTGLTIAARSGSDPSLDRATVTLGPMKAGRDVSTFVFFDGADFSFAARTPARQANLFAYTAQLTEALSLTVAVENPPDAATQIAQGAPAAAGARWPDLVGRLLYESDTMGLHASGALRELRRPDGGPTRIASAFLIGGWRDVEVAGVTHTLLAQGGGTLGGPVFIGSQLDSTDVLTLLTGGEVASGWSALTSLSSAWTDTISTNAYASRYMLRVPARTSAAGRIDIARYAVNIVWKPARMLKLGVEIGVSRSNVTIPRLSMTSSTIQRMAASVWLQKSF